MRVWGIHPSGDDDPDRWPPVTLPFVAAAFAIGIAASAWTGALARAPAVWALFAIAIAVRARMRRSGSAWVLVAAALGASLASRERAAPARVPAAASPDHRAATVTIDDRVDDTLVGIVVGPVVRLADGDAVIIDAGARVLAIVARDAVLPGDRVRVTGRVRRPRGFRNPGGVDRAQIVRDRGAELEMTVDALTIVERDAASSGWRVPTRLHRAASDAIAARAGDAAGNAIVRAAVTGDRSAVDDATDDAWRAAGIYHALSVSGMHLAVVAMLLFGLVRRVWACFPGLVGRIDPGRAAAVVAAPVAVAYTLLTGGQTATLRALVVVLAILLGVALRRRLRVLDAVALAAIAILASRPSSLGDPSFQLSFAAALTLCATSRRRPGVLGWLTAALRVSLWIAATTAPITAWHFHQIALGGVIGNVALAPLVELVVIPAGLAGLGLGSGALIDLSVAIAGLVARGAATLATVTPVLDVPPPRAIEVVAWYGLLAAAWTCHACRGGRAHAGRPPARPAAPRRSSPARSRGRSPRRACAATSASPSSTSGRATPRSSSSRAGRSGSSTPAASSTASAPAIRSAASSPRAASAASTSS